MIHGQDREQLYTVAIDKVLSDKLEDAGRPVYITHIEHSLRRRAYERSCGIVTEDPTRVQSNLTDVFKRELTPMFEGTIVVDFNDAGEATCKVFRGQPDIQGVLVSDFTYKRTP
jgi:hypothetical protein